MARTIVSAEERFMAKVSVDPDTGCWLWTGFRHPKCGYGVFRVSKGLCNQAHRFAYEHFIAPIPAGMFCLHACDRPNCCNPRHMFIGTKQDNTSDMVRKGRYPQSHKLGLPTGVHLITGSNPPRYAVRVCYKMKMMYFGKTYETPEEAGEVAAYHRARLHGA